MLEADIKRGGREGCGARLRGEMSRDADHSKQHQGNDTAGKNPGTPHVLGLLLMVLITGMRVLTVPHVRTYVLGGRCAVKPGDYRGASLGERSGLSWFMEVRANMRQSERDDQSIKMNSFECEQYDGQDRVREPPCLSYG